MTRTYSAQTHLQSERPDHHNSVLFLSCVTGQSIRALCALLFIVLMGSCASTSHMEDIRMAEALNKMGSSYLNDGQLNEASIEFQKALSLDPKNKETLNYLGYISTRFKKYDEAISYYKRAISLDPEYADAINNLGVTYTELENWDEAIRQFERALKNPLYRTPARTYSNIGYAYYKKGDFDKAKTSLQDALIRNPVFPRAMYILGLIYRETGDSQSAIEEFKKAIGILPDYTDAHWELARAYFSAGKKAKALKHFQVVFEKDTDRERRREASNYIEQLKY